MEKLTLRRRLAVAGLVTLGGLSLAGCDTAGDYEGIGNEFVVRGPLDEVTIDLVEISGDQMEIINASGRASRWFTEGFGQELFTGDFRFHNQLTDPDGATFWTCGTDVIVGRVIDTDGTEMPLDELDRDDYVQVSGHIRDSEEPAGKAGCQPQGRAVFDTVVVLEDR